MPKEYGLPKTLYNRWKRWSEMGVFARIFEGLAAEAANQKTIMIDVTYLKAHRTASSMRSKKGGALSADRAEWLLGDRGYDADWFCDALKDKGIRPCIPGRKTRGKPVKYRQAPLQKPQPHRNHVRQAEGLAPVCDTR